MTTILFVSRILITMDGILDYISHQLTIMYMKAAFLHLQNAMYD